MQLRHIIIDNIEELAPYEEIWQQIHASSNRRSIMCLDWAWLYQWCKLYLLPSDKLAIRLIFHEEKVIGLFPFYIKSHGLIKTLRFIGTGEDEAIEVCSEFQDIMVLPPYEAVILKHLREYLASDKSFNHFCFNHILQNSFLAQSVTNSFHEHARVSKMAIGLRYIMKVEDYTNEQIRKFASKTIKRHAKKALASQNLSFEIVENEQVASKVFEQLGTIHNEMWRKRGEIGVFEAKQFLDFHQHYINNLIVQKRLVMFAMYYRDVLAGVYYGVISGEVLFYYQSGMKREITSQYIGVAMHLKAMELARSKGVMFYDLMTGQPSSYKKRYLRSDVEVFTLKAWRFPYYYFQLLGNLANKLFRRLIG